MKRPNFPYFRAFYTVVSKGNVQKIALIIDTPFVETLLVLPDKWHFPAEKSVDFPPWGLMTFAGNPVICAAKRRFPHPESRKKLSQNPVAVFSCSGLLFPLPLLYRTEHFSRGRNWQKCAEKRRGRGVASKKGKKEKRKQVRRCFRDPAVVFRYHRSILMTVVFLVWQGPWGIRKVLNLDGKEKTNKHKEFWRDPPGVRPVCPADTSHLPRDTSRLSRGHSVPLVLIYT